MQLQVMCNSILLTLETLLGLLKETKIIGKNLGKIRAREVERADQWESLSMQVEVAIDTLLLNRELISGGGLCRHRERSQWEDQPQGEVVVKGRGHQRRINAL